MHQGGDRDPQDKQNSANGIPSSGISCTVYNAVFLHPVKKIDTGPLLPYLVYFLEQKKPFVFN